MIYPLPIDSFASFFFFSFTQILVSFLSILIHTVVVKNL
jgi:hypothetical protein